MAKALCIPQESLRCSDLHNCRERGGSALAQEAIHENSKGICLVHTSSRKPDAAESTKFSENSEPDHLDIDK